MEIQTIIKNTVPIAIVQSEEILISDVQSALDLMATISYNSSCNNIILNKSAVTEDFFRLSTRLAGEILQKFVTYKVKFAIVGDYSHYTSKPLKDFIYESNHGKDVFFVETVEEAVEKIGQLYHPIRINMNKFHTLEDDIIAFKTVHGVDIDEIHSYTSDAEVSRYIGWRLMQSREETFQHVEIMRKREGEGTHLYASVVLKSTGRVIGTAMLFDFDLQTRNAEIGYVFHKDYWGKGYGTRCAALVCGYAKEVLQFHKLHASVVEENTGSAKILEKNGFCREGVLKDHYRIEGRYCNCLLYGRIL